MLGLGLIGVGGGALCVCVCVCAGGVGIALCVVCARDCAVLGRESGGVRRTEGRKRESVVSVVDLFLN